jgi:Domain of unknown function (DUF4388)
MALKGNLRDFNTSQLLNLISLAHKTGTLTVEAPAEAAFVAFREGKLIFAQLGGEDGNLAYVLRKAGKLTEGQFRVLRERASRASDKELGLLLINAGYVTQSEILQILRQHILDVVYRVFTWVEGGFRFDANILPPDDRITIPIDLDNVIIEGTRRRREWEHLQEELPNLDMALKFTDQPDSRLRNVNLSVEEWRVVSYINPKNSMRQIARATNLPELELRRIVYALLQAGIVEVVRPAGEPPPAPDGARRLPVGLGGTRAEQKSLINRLIARIRSL